MDTSAHKKINFTDLPSIVQSNYGRDKHTIKTIFMTDTTPIKFIVSFGDTQDVWSYKQGEWQFEVE